MLKHFIVTTQTYAKPDRLWINPTWLGLEITTACNSNCKICPRDNYQKDKKKENVLGFDNFKYIFDHIKPKILSIAGVGENFLNSEYLLMVKYASEKGALVYSTTNGILLKKYAEATIDSGLNEIVLSLDGYSPDTYNNTRRIDAFKTIIKGIQDLNFIKGRTKSNLIIGFNVVVQNSNYKHLNAFIDIAHENSVSVINFLPMEVHYDLIDNKQFVEKIERVDLKNNISKAHLYSQKYGISTNLPFWLKHYDLIWKKLQLNRNAVLTHRTCHNPWSSTFIKADGTVLPCCGLVTDKIAFGNIFDESLKEILNSSEAVKFRKILKQGKKPFIRCKGCLIVPFSDLIIDMARRRLLF